MDGRVDTSGHDPSDYDEEQRAEILEAEGSHPIEGAVETDLRPDTGGAIDGEVANDELLSDSDMP